MPKGLARATMAYFAAAFSCFVAAQVLMVGGLTYPQAGLGAPVTLVAVHLVTIGWLTLLMFGALRQFVPVIAATRPAGDSVAVAALVAILAGLSGMLAGFLGLGGIWGLSAMPWLPVGGALVGAGMVTVATTLAATLWRARPLPLAARFVAAGLAFLMATLALGLTMAIALTRPQTFAATALGRIFVQGLALHLAVGIGGWFTLTAMGVAYKLMAMFMLAPDERGRRGEWAFRLSAGGLAWVAIAGLAGLLTPGPWWAAGLSFAQTFGWAGAGAGVALYLADMLRLYRTRRRRALELNGLFGVWALMALLFGVLLSAFGGLFGHGPSEAGPIAYLFLFGWLSGLGLSQLYKIVPFLTWIETYGSMLGKQPVPRVQDLVDERRARPWFILYFAGVTAGACSGLAGHQDLWRWSAAAVLLATLAIGRQVWRAQHARPQAAADPLGQRPPSAGPDTRHRASGGNRT